MTDMRPGIPESSMESLDVNLFMTSLITPLPVDLEPGIGDRNMEPSGGLLLFGWDPEYFVGYPDDIGLV